MFSQFNLQIEFKIFNLKTSCWCLDCPGAITGYLRLNPLKLQSQEVDIT